MKFEKFCLTILLTAGSIFGASAYGQGLRRPQPQFIIDDSALTIEASMNLLFGAPIQPISEFKQVKYVEGNINVVLVPHVLHSGATLAFESTRGVIGSRVAISVGCNTTVTPIPLGLSSFQAYGALLTSGQAILARDFNNVTGNANSDLKKTVLILCQ